MKTKKMVMFKILYIMVLVAMLSFLGAASAAAARMDGTWVSDTGGRLKVLVLQERADGRLIGYLPADPGTHITGGSLAGSAVTINLSGADPVLTWSAVFTGALHGKRLVGAYDDGSGPRTLTFERTSRVFTVEHWILGVDGTDDKVRAVRVLASDGTFLTGGFVGIQTCGLLACSGEIANWTISGMTHTITTLSSGTCSSSSTLEGMWDPSIPLLTGSYTTTDCLGTRGGTFIGGKEGLTTTTEIRGVLRMQADFVDRIESESTRAADAFASFYLNDGKTKADWETQLSAMYAGYNNVEARIDGVTQIITYNDTEVHPLISAAPRMEWRLIVSGDPAAGGPRETVMNISAAPIFSEELYWLGNVGSRQLFVGNGYAQHFSINMPILLGDAAHTAYGLWPFGVHGGGHPEGHMGWDVEYAAGAKVRAAADGTVSDIQPNSYHPGEWIISVQHRPGYFTRYDDLGGVEPGIAVGTPVRAGDPLGAPSEHPNGASSFFMIHFAVNVEGQTECPEDYLTAGGHSLFDGIWQTAAYGEEFTEPLPCNAVAVTFPLTRTWLRVSGPLAPKIEFTRLDPATSAYTYRLLDVGGAVLESGAISWFNPSALPYSTIDLLPSGGTAPHLGVYDIVSGTMRITWDDVVRPTDLTGASVYTLAL